MATTTPLAPGPTASGAGRAPRGRRLWALGAMVVAVALAVVLVAVVVATRSTDTVPSARSGVGAVAIGDGTALVEADDGGAPDLVAVVTDEGPSEQPRTTLVRAGFDGEVRWRQPIDPESSPPNVLTADERVVLLAQLPETGTLQIDPTQVVALDADDGTELWRIDGPKVRANPLIVGDRVVVPGDDGSVRGYDIRTGEEVWAHDDPENTTELAPAVDVLDDDTVLVARTRDRYGIELVPVAVVDGSEGPAFGPACAGLEGREERATDASSVLPVPETSDAVAVFGFGYGPTCVQRWDTATGELRWSVTPEPQPVEPERPRFPRSVAVDADHVAFDGDDGIIVVDLADGAFRVLEPADGDQVAPLFVSDGSVVAAAVGDEGAEPILDGWAVDETTARWSDVALVGPEAVGLVVGRTATAMPAEASATVVADEEDGVVRTVVLDGTTDGTVGTLDPATGETTETPFVLPSTGDAARSPLPASVRIVGDHAVVVVAGVPHLVDVATGEVVASWSGS